MHLARNYNKVLIACPFSHQCGKRFGSLSAMARHINSAFCPFELTESQVALSVHSTDVGNQLTTASLPKAVQELMAKRDKGYLSGGRSKTDSPSVVFHCPCLHGFLVCPKASAGSFNSIAGLIEHLETLSCPDRVEALQFVADIVQSAINRKIASSISLKDYAQLASTNRFREQLHLWWSAELGYPPWQRIFVPAANHYVAQGSRTSISDLRLFANEMYSSFTSLRTASRAMNAVPKLWCSLSILGYKVKKYRYSHQFRTIPSHKSICQWRQCRQPEYRPRRSRPKCP